MYKLIKIFGNLKNLDEISSVSYNFMENDYDLILFLDKSSLNDDFYDIYDEEDDENIFEENDDESLPIFSTDVFTAKKYEYMKKEYFNFSEMFSHWSNENFIEFIKIVDGELLGPNSEFKKILEDEIQKRVNIFKNNNYYRDFGTEERLKSFIDECYASMKANRKVYLEKMDRYSKVLEFAQNCGENYKKHFVDTYKKYKLNYSTKAISLDENFIEEIEKCSYDDIVDMIVNNNIDIEYLDPECEVMQEIEDIIDREVDRVCDIDKVELEEIENIFQETYGNLIHFVETSIRYENNKSESLKNVLAFLYKKQEELVGIDREDEE